MTQDVHGAARPVPATAGPASLTDPIDWSGLEARYARRPAFVERLTDVAIATMRDVPAQLRRLADAGRHAEVAAVAHSLRTGTDVIMAHGARDLASRVEAACRAEAADAMAITRELAEAVDLLVAALQRRVDQQRG
jgi:hypothetical protein